MGSKGSEIVVGIDFGTTHSGVSWAVNGGAKVIRLITNWEHPQSSNPTNDKVPSSISYTSGKPQNWGYRVGLNDESFRWIKILLEENHKYAKMVEPVKDSNVLLRKVEKTAQEVVADYLKLIWQYTIEDIRRFHPQYEQLFSIRVVLTVPAIWSPAAKDKTQQAAKLAGIPGKIQLVTEPEAAALATLKERAADNAMKVGDAFVVCDAGGGTVDLISYKVDELNPLKLKECAIGSGGLCGSAFLDEAFVRYIETIVGESQYKALRESNRKRMLKEFEYGPKRCFTGKTNEEYSVDLRGVKDDPSNGIVDETITIKPKALEACFDQVSQQIQKLVADQIADVEERGLKVKAILLVGGFGESKYIYNRLKAAQDPKGIDVLQVTGGWSSVCRGATLWGLEHPGEVAQNPLLPDIGGISLGEGATVTSRLSRYNYGMCFSETYDPSKHLLQDLYRDPRTGRAMAGSQMTWLLKRGEEVQEGRILSTECSQIIEVGFWDSGNMDFSSNLWYSEQPRASATQTNEVKPLCRVDWTIGRDKLWLEKSFKGADKIKHRKADFLMLILLGNASLDFVVVYRNDIVGHVEAKYLQKFD